MLILESRWRDLAEEKCGAGRKVDRTRYVGFGSGAQSTSLYVPQLDLNSYDTCQLSSMGPSISADQRGSTVSCLFDASYSLTWLGAKFANQIRLFGPNLLPLTYLVRV